MSSTLVLLWDTCNGFRYKNFQTEIYYKSYCRLFRKAIVTDFEKCILFYKNQHILKIKNRFKICNK